MLKSSFFILKIKKKMEHCEDEGRAVVRTNENWLRRHTLWTEETHRIWNWIVWGTRRRQEAVVEKFGEHVIRNMMQFYRCWNEISCNSNLLPFFHHILHVTFNAGRQSTIVLYTVVTFWEYLDSQSFFLKKRIFWDNHTFFDCTSLYSIISASNNEQIFPTIIYWYGGLL